jgi:uncharacterized protein
MTEVLRSKESKLYALLRSAGRIVIAFSGGVDSTYLLWAAHEVLGSNAVAVTISSAVIPENELSDARSLCSSIGVRQIVIGADVFSIDRFRENPPDRCYWCKKALFGKILDEAHKNGIDTVADGSNADDDSDYRPGTKAAKELGIISPLKNCGLTKSDIRELSKEAGLPTWNNPSMACLASRFPYGDQITPEGLKMVESAESVLKLKGLSQYRVRKIGGLARIEVLPEEFPLITENMKEISSEFMKMGFEDVILDPKGYRTGSMNELL